MYNIIHIISHSLKYLLSSISEIQRTSHKIQRLLILNQITFKNLFANSSFNIRSNILNLNIISISTSQFFKFLFHYLHRYLRISNNQISLNILFLSYNFLHNLIHRNNRSSSSNHIDIFNNIEVLLIRNQTYFFISIFAVKSRSTRSLHFKVVTFSHIFHEVRHNTFRVYFHNNFELPFGSRSSNRSISSRNIFSFIILHSEHNMLPRSKVASRFAVQKSISEFINIHSNLFFFLHLTKLKIS